jgi:hypothetical protein
MPTSQGKDTTYKNTQLCLSVGDYHVIRGTLDTQAVANRKQSRSLYGAKRPK